MFYLNIVRQEDCAVGFNLGQLQRVDGVEVGNSLICLSVHATGKKITRTNDP